MTNRTQKIIVVSAIIILTSLILGIQWTPPGLRKVQISSVMQASEVGGVISTRPEVLLTLKVTAYSSEPSQTDSTPFEAAWGHRVHNGMIAVSRDLEALGLTRWLARFELIDRYVWFYPTLEIDGREFVVKDRLHKRKRGQLDIWMESTEDALEWGVQYKIVKVINCSNLIIFDLVQFDDCLQLADINQQFSG